MAYQIPKQETASLLTFCVFHTVFTSVAQYGVMMQYRYCLSKYCDIAIYCREGKSPKHKKKIIMIIIINILSFSLIVLAVIILITIKIINNIRMHYGAINND